MSQEPVPANKRKLKPPPNFQSRKMQIRLFVLVAACMGVLYLATEAANPQSWGWFFGQSTAEVPAESPDVDTLLPDADAPNNSDPDVVRIVDPFRGSLDDAAALNAVDPVARAEADGWSAFFEQASRDEHDLVAKALLFASEKKVFGFEDGTAWNELLEKMDGHWQGYRLNALKALEAPKSQAGDEGPSLSEEERNRWIAVLDKVQENWRADRAVLAKVAQAGDFSLADEQAERLSLWQLRWERLGLAAIKDDTVHRPQEGDAWFRLFAVLLNTPQTELEQQAVERVNYLQMYKETESFRGKLVRFQGRIMQAKPIKAERNVYGIKQQYLLWIKPEDGPKTPVVVYALEMPKGFPSLDQPNIDGGYTKFRDGEDVVIIGYLFKRWAYRATQGTHTAPLVLTKAPYWVPSPVVTRGDELPSRQTFLLWVAGCALFGIAVASAIYLRTRAASPALESFQNSPAAQAELQRSLNTADAGPGPLEALRLLEERDQQSEGKST